MTWILVGGFKHFLFSILYMACHPSHWRTHIFQDGYCTTNQLSSIFSYVYNGKDYYRYYHHMDNSHLITVWWTVKSSCVQTTGVFTVSILFFVAFFVGKIIVWMLGCLQVWESFKDSFWLGVKPRSHRARWLLKPCFFELVGFVRSQTVSISQQRPEFSRSYQG